MGGGITDVDRGVCPAPTGVDGDGARAEMIERMRRVVELRDSILLTVQDEFRGDLESHALPREMLAGRRQFESDEERLVYLRFTIEQENRAPQLYGFADPPKGVVAEKMADYELARIKSVAAQAVPSLPGGSPYIPGGTAQDIAIREKGLEWAQAVADGDRSEYEAYLFEYGRMDDEARQERAKPFVYSGAATVDVYQQYIGAPFTGVVAQAVRATPLLVSLLLDFTPIVGQIKAVAEAIYGKDLITGRELETWERGLGALLAIIPEVRGIFKAGRAGLRVLATVAKDSGRTAEEVYRVTKVASRLTEEEVVAARQIANGRPANPKAAEKVVGSIEEMVGNKPRGARSVSWRAAAGVIEDGRGISRSVAASPIKVGARTVGKVVQATKTAEKFAGWLARGGISADAVAALERAGIKITEDVALLIVNDAKIGGFINRFHGCTGFEEVVKDVIKSGTKKKGGMLVIEFVMDSANKIDPAAVRFELPAGITKGSRADKVARFTDLVITDGNGTLNYEFKAYAEASVAAALSNPKKLAQLLKDVAMFGRRNIRWVYDSREATREFILKRFKEAIKNDAFLTKEFGEGAQLEQSLDELIVMYPPVPKAPRMPIPYSAPVKAAGTATSSK